MNSDTKPNKQSLIHDVMPRFYYRLSNAFKLFIWAFKKPDTLKESTFKMCSDLLVMIMKAATDNRHMMTHIAYIHPDEGEKQIVSIWAGAGIGAEPTKRIAELLSENSRLKAELARSLPQNEL
jgi:hypothetical protein